MFLHSDFFIHVMKYLLFVLFFVYCVSYKNWIVPEMIEVVNVRRLHALFAAVFVVVVVVIITYHWNRNWNWNCCCIIIIVVVWHLWLLWRRKGRRRLSVRLCHCLIAILTNICIDIIIVIAALTVVSLSDVLIGDVIVISVIIIAIVIAVVVIISAISARIYLIQMTDWYLSNKSAHICFVCVVRTTKMTLPLSQRLNMKYIFFYFFLYKRKRQWKISIIKQNKKENKNVHIRWIYVQRFL